LSKIDQPQNDADIQDLVTAVNAMFPDTVSTHAETITKYKSLVMGIGWFATMLGPTLRLTVSVLGRAMHAPSIKAFKAAKQVLRHIKGTIGTGITYHKTKDWDHDEYPQLEYGSDASLADDPDTLKTQGGYVARFPGQAATTFVSRQSATLCTSTYQAETHFASEAVKDIYYKRALFNELQFTITGPTRLFIDNQATVLDSGSPIRKFSSKSKHFTLQERLATQATEDGSVQIIKIDGSQGITLTSDSIHRLHDCDAMTKPLAKEDFQRYSLSLMGAPPPTCIEKRG
jgi:hypothetical protein